MHVFLAATIAALAIPLLAGCQAAPRARPVKMGPVDTGIGSVESVRRQLQGTWELVRLDVYSSSGEKTTAQATGRLQYDDHGNMAIHGTITGSATLEPSVLNLEGRVAIDPDQHILRITSVTAKSKDDRRVDPKLDPAHVRYYAFEGELLTTTIKNASGATTATTTWKKIG
jgi:hypothetical protein